MRLPPLTTLAGMMPVNRWGLLSVLAREARHEIEGLLDGSIVAPRGALKNAKRRLKRIEDAARLFDDYIGEDKPRVRVKAISRPLAA